MDNLSVLLDTNILLDVLLIRQPFAVSSRKVWDAHDLGIIEGFVSTLSLATVFYVSTNTRSKKLGYSNAAAMSAARTDVQTCLNTFQICSVGYQDVRLALAMPGSDVEDNIQLACAYKQRLAAIVTRDKKFAGSTIPVLSPAALLQRIKLVP